MTILTTSGVLDNSRNTVLYPVGAVVAFPTNNGIAGWLKCNGSAISRTTYSDLFTLLSTTYGTGDGSTTFNVPDLRAYFIRSWDDSSGRDPTGVAFGGSSASDIVSHNHSMSTYAGNPWYGSYGRMSDSYNSRNIGLSINGSTPGTYPKNFSVVFYIKY